MKQRTQKRERKAKHQPSEARGSKREWHQKSSDSKLPMLRVTVMMFRLIVESVMLLKEEDWQGRKGEVS